MKTVSGMYLPLISLNAIGLIAHTYICGAYIEPDSKKEKRPVVVWFALPILGIDNTRAHFRYATKAKASSERKNFTPFFAGRRKKWIIDSLVAQYGILPEGSTCFTDRTQRGAASRIRMTGDVKGQSLHVVFAPLGHGYLRSEFHPQCLPVFHSWCLRVMCYL